uniref:Uncharacterized protein n=1 Tax=Anguilla anguilla TaxID=7936 RepID=A0A0E9RIS3_ANGAN
MLMKLLRMAISSLGVRTFLLLGKPKLISQQGCKTQDPSALLDFLSLSTACDN